MNNPASHNMSTSQPRQGDGTTLGEFFTNDLQSYANYQPETETPQDEYIWDPSLFANPQIYSPPVTTHTPAWNQNAAAQSRDSPLTAYGGLQSSFQLSQYGQPSFDPRQPSPQPGHDPRLISRPSPSPTPYNNQNQQPTMAYRDLSYHNQQQFNPQTMVYPQPSASAAASTSTFDGQTNRSPYFNYGSQLANQSQLQGLDLSNNLGGFPGQQQSRPAAPFIDPSFLTANAVQRHRPESAQSLYPFLRQENVQTQPGGQQTQVSAMPNNFQGASMQTGHPGVFMGVFAPPKPEKAPGKPGKPKDPNAPKRLRGRPRKDGSQPSSNQGAEASTSESESDELQIEEMPEPTPDLLRGPPPEAPEHKVIYDIAVAVWSPRNKPAVAEKVRKGIALFGDVVKKQRDSWKVKNEALKQAELANTTAIPNLKQEVAQFRRTIETMAVQALRFGHPAHLAKLGENPFTMSALQSFLVDRINALDMDGSLVTSILKLMDHFTTLDEEMLEKTKTSKILARLTKKAGNEVKALAQMVLDHAASASKRKAASSAKTEGGESPKPVLDQKATTAAGIKRPRETDGGTLPATKRTVVPTPIKQASKPLALQNAERKKLESAASRAKIAAPLANGASSSTAPLTASKPAVTAAVPPRPVPSPFSGLMSASKRPGTSIAARAAAAKEKVTVSPAPVVKKPSPPPVAAVKIETTIPSVAKSTFSFMDTLADMSRPKPVEEKKVDDRPPETEEERKKRIRKEERRKLRVSWAPENELTQIKLFVHDPEEEIGHADSAMRDVDDVGGEGRMLKLHKDLDDFDEDDDGRTTTDDMEAYYAPTEVDFSTIDEAARQISFIRRGGFEKAESGESEAQDAREETTLMVVYALPSDVPPTPKEPPAAGDEDDYTPLTSFGEPDEKTRGREEKYYEQQRAQQQSAAATPDLNAILNVMKQNQQQSAQQPVFNPFTPQPQSQQQPAQGVDISKILAVMSQMQQPQPQPQPQPAAPEPQQQAGQLNLAALLAQMQGQQQPAQSVQPLPYGYTGNQNPYPSADNDYSRKHGRNEFTADYDEDSAWKKKKAAGGNGAVVGGGGGSGGSAKPHPKAKTVVCKFWQEGKCKKGDDCTFIHES